MQIWQDLILKAKEEGLICASISDFVHFNLDFCSLYSVWPFFRIFSMLFFWFIS